MKKTNRFRAVTLLENWVIIPHTNEANIRNIAAALDKAERRGARKACQCCKPQPEPQFDAEKVESYLEEIVHHRFMAGYMQTPTTQEQYKEHFQLADKALSSLLAVLYLSLSTPSRHARVGECHRCLCSVYYKLSCHYASPLFFYISLVKCTEPLESVKLPVPE